MITAFRPLLVLTAILATGCASLGEFRPESTTEILQDGNARFTVTVARNKDGSPAIVETYFCNKKDGIFTKCDDESIIISEKTLLFAKKAEIRTNHESGAPVTAVGADAGIEGFVESIDGFSGKKIAGGDAGNRGAALNDTAGGSVAHREPPKTLATASSSSPKETPPPTPTPERKQQHIEAPPVATEERKTETPATAKKPETPKNSAVSDSQSPKKVKAETPFPFNISKTPSPSQSVSIKQPALAPAPMVKAEPCPPYPKTHQCPCAPAYSGPHGGSTTR